MMMHQAGCMMVQCRNSGHSTDAYRGCVSTGKGAAWEQKALIHEPLYYSENMQPMLPLEF